MHNPDELNRLAERVEALPVGDWTDDQQERDIIAAELRALAAQSATPEHIADASNMVGISGEVVEIGDDETGRPRIVINTTREAMKAHPGNLLFKRVMVSALPNTQEPR